MPHLKHATKKRLNRSTTRKKTITTGISAEFTTYRQKLDLITTAVTTLSKQILTTRSIWTEIASHQRDFATTLYSALPQPGPVRTHAEEVDLTVRDAHRRINDDGASAAPHRRIASVLDGYLVLLKSVEADYPPVETSYTEVLRYEKKVDKLQKQVTKNSKASEKESKRQDKLTRNLTKSQSARQEHDKIVVDILGRMHSVYDKHEAVFQCAHHAFWIANDTFANAINGATHGIRAESLSVHHQLVNIDVAKVTHLQPIPRIASATVTHNSPATALGIASASADTDTDGIVVVEHMGTISTPVATKPAMITTPLTVINDQYAQAKQKSLNIPDVPTVMPTSPTAMANPRMTAATVTISSPTAEAV